MSPPSKLYGTRPESAGTREVVGRVQKVSVHKERDLDLS